MKVFLSGIAGTGMSSLAGLFSEKGYRVSGSDVNFYPPVDKILEKMKARVFSPYDSRNIPEDMDFCVIGNVISRGNPEAEAILDKGMEYYSMAEALYKYFIKGTKSIVVCGTHGKTTISSFIAHLLETAGEKPGFFIGGKPKNFPANYALGSGKYFVTEGDEYETAFFDRSSKFLKYHPLYLILSALEYDHIDFFPDESLYIRSFQNLVNQVPGNGLIILNNDFPMNREVVEKAFTPIVTYGIKDCDYVLKNITYDPRSGYYRFVLKSGSKEATFTSKIPGRYNLWNETAGIILGFRFGIPEKTIRQAVESFEGVERRLNIINRVGKTIFLEDFAHHPTSIKNVLQSLQEAFPGKKIITLFEPRSWSLRRNIFQERLAESFSDSHEIIIKEVFQKEKIPETERLDVDRIKQELEQQGKKVRVVKHGKEIEDYLLHLDFSQSNLVVILSNGSFDNIPTFVKHLQEHLAQTDRNE
ncbi:MAG: UDP-N-acetylmuramate:L-alanyl-gamma-D-glutamyl-meso-diaminopimelate ligase [Candidatus Aminicenantes bacterium]|nr:UDP-N-acetylmuramate:L-alanyl-gamma-D-glutamyl-meso-diaminopimelate ligase [Candidatus Aminicenantes bacterium]